MDHTIRYSVSKARPGIYVGRFRYAIDGQPRIYHATFVVKKPDHRPKSQILVLAATGTWGAYSATMPAEPLGIVTLAHGKQPNAAAFDYFFRPVRLVDGDPPEP